MPLFPPTGPRSGAPPSERAVYDALAKHLPKSWHAWHSVRLRNRRGVETEGDFVLAIPDRGLLVLECKGGLIDVVEGLWFQNGKPLARMPREQAHDFRRALAEQLDDRGVGRVFIDVATIFPETPFFSPPAQSDLRDTVLGQRDLDALGDALKTLVSRLFVAPDGQRASVPEGTRWIEAMHELWGRSWVKAARLGQQLALREEELVPLDERQRAVLELLDDNDRLLVTGGPGTGKTLLAMEIARRLRRDGKRVLVLCFTRALASALAAAGIEATTVRELAADVLDIVERAPDGPRETWSAETWDGVTAAAAQWLPEEGDTTHDAFLLDEAQDLADADWRFVRALAGNRKLWVFGDDGQAYWPDRLRLDAKAEGFASCRLSRGYRNPDGLDRFAAQYRLGAEEPWVTPPLAGLRVVSAASEAEIAREVERLVLEATREGLSPSDLAVLSLAGRSRARIGIVDKLAGLTACRADAPDAKAHLVADTFLRFKGLERPLVIVCELGLGPQAYDVRMHIALTRATLQCAVVATRAEITADARLRAATSR